MQGERCILNPALFVGENAPRADRDLGEEPFSFTPSSY